ncbi:MAG: hypothetical protein D6748_05740 [Calditrichaeota bacterium]|nr:MAG: hypothetical protein D6748_05740 [Calditrichota bacterium]
MERAGGLILFFEEHTSQATSVFWKYRGRFFTIVFFAILLFSNFIPISARDSQQYDFLIIENPRVLKIYNKYQQQLSSQQLKQLPNFIPIRILEPEVEFSDGITKVLKGEYQNSLFYIQLDERDRLFLEEEAGMVQKYRNCELLSDSVEILQSGTIELTRRPSFRSAGEMYREYLDSGVKLLRIFKWRGWSYVRKLRNNNEFGWCYLPLSRENEYWRTLEYQQEISLEKFEQIAREIQKELDEVNTILQIMYAQLNAMQREQHIPPFWKMEIGDNEIICYPDTQPGKKRYRESVRILEDRIRNIVLGTGYQVSHEGNVIIIKQ